MIWTMLEINDFILGLICCASMGTYVIAWMLPMEQICNLITVLVIDEFGEGIPVAWAIANREDMTMLIEFLEAIEKRTGPLEPRWFMSDDAHQYFKAWKGVFGLVKCFLHPTFHNRESIAPAQPNHNLLWNMSARR